MNPYHWHVRWMRWALVSIVAVGVAPATAGASPIVLAPPGHPGANQYFETIPSSSGEAAPPGSVKGSGSPNAGPSALSHFGQGRKADARLAQLGKNGAAAAALAASTAPVVPYGLSPARAKSDAATSSASGGGSVASGIAHALTGSSNGGLGIALPLLLATALIVALGVGVGGRLWRRARTSQPGV
jgi:hypothetical protein